MSGGIVIKRALDCGGAVGEQISALFVEAYEKDLRFFSKDRSRLTRAFAHIFALDFFYVALIDNEIAGMAVCIDTERYCIRLDKKILIKQLGCIKGLAAHLVFKYYFNKYPKYDTALDAKTASIEFVATAAKYRNRGVATAIMQYLVALPEYEAYMLEVADTNAAACALYTRIGFRELFRKAIRFGKKYSGVNFLIYMRYSKEPRGSSGAGATGA